jgi:phosphoglycerate kinase
MAYTFKLAQGFKIGKSLAEPDKIGIAIEALAKARKRGVKFQLPTDNVVATPVKTDKLNKKGKPIVELHHPRINAEPNIADSEEGVDIGPATAQAYAAEIARARTILWNGPMGIFEDRRLLRAPTPWPAPWRGDSDERRQEHYWRWRQCESAEQSGPR